MSKFHCGSDSCPGDVYDPASCECPCGRCNDPREDDHGKQSTPHRDRIATLERELAEVRRERDALRAKRVTGPWIHESEKPWGDKGTVENWDRFGSNVFCNVCVFRRTDGTVETWAVVTGGLSRGFPDPDAARAACDAHLLGLDDGWWIEGGAFVTAPKPETPGDDGR